MEKLGSRMIMRDEEVAPTHLLGMSLAYLRDGHLFETAHETGVVKVGLIGRFLAGQSDLEGVGDHDVISRID